MPDAPSILQNGPNASSFITTLDGESTALIKLKNQNGISVALTNYGARIVSIKMPDKSGNIADIVLGYDSIDKYLSSKNPYFGATIGRFANRIAKGHIQINNQSYQLDVNAPPHHLHGGADGFHSRIWSLQSESSSEAVMNLNSHAGDSGYPGNLNIKVTYDLNNENELSIQYEAISDASTVINLTNHAYFNLNGAGSGSVGEHLVYIDADQFTPVNQHLIPIGLPSEVKNTPFDFTVEKRIDQHWDNNEYEQIYFAEGFDHNYVLNKNSSNQLKLAAKVTDPSSGRVLEVETTEPGLQFYTANAMNSKDVGREGKPYFARSAFCLETQHFPDSPNHDSFPSVILEAGETYKSTTIYRFKYQ